MRTPIQHINADFTCKHCGRLVSANSIASGVVHRNHCPTCLHSRHVDLFQAGDRLCACKSLMAPVGLTLKHTLDKYASQRGGELMLVHRCTHCGAIVINRIAADDNPTKILGLISGRHSIQSDLKEDCRTQGIRMLTSADLGLAHTRLYGDKEREITSERLIHQAI